MKKRTGYLLMAVLFFVAVLVVITLVATSNSVRIRLPGPPMPPDPPVVMPVPLPPPTPPTPPDIALRVNTETPGSLSSETDAVSYSVTLDSPGFVILDFTHENLHKQRLGWRILLTDDSSDGLVSFASNWNEPKASSPAIGLPAGTYRITIDSPPYGAAYYWNAARYALTVRFTAASDWETEFNGTFENADTIAINAPVTGTLRTDTDADFYTFTLDSPAYVNLDFSHANLIHPHKGWRVRLFDDRSNELSGIGSCWNDSICSTPNRLLPSGTYFAVIDRYPQFDLNSSWSAERYSLRVSVSPDQPVSADDLPEDILSEGTMPSERLRTFLLKKNPALEYSYASELIDRYIAEANVEGVNYEIAFAQMCLHTNYLRFTKTVATKDQNNFFGLVYDDKRTAYAFDSMEVGVRAHIQHLKGYATAEELERECVDPRYGILKHGLSPTIGGLEGRWAGNGYADKIRAILRDMRG